jgi:glycosyltransferase involved in cell wall biosynthesis
MVTVEAMASGVPVIGTNKGGTPEILSNGKAGLLYEPTDVNKLVEHIESLYQNKEKRMDICLKAREQAKLYSHEIQCQRLEELLRNI